MALIEWSEAYRTGNPEVDGQHERLFALLNRLHDGIMSGLAEEAMASALIELTDYVDEHFRTEENLMLESGYPVYEQHRALHIKLLNQVEEFRRSRNASKPPLPLDLVRLVSSWIQYHILLEDVKLVHWLEKGTMPAGARPG